jgi:hypothetical protein
MVAGRDGSVSSSGLGMTETAGAAAATVLSLDERSDKGSAMAINKKSPIITDINIIFFLSIYYVLYTYKNLPQSGKR